MRSSKLSLAMLGAIAGIAAAGVAAHATVSASKKTSAISFAGSSSKGSGRANRSRPGAQMAFIRKARKARNVKRFRAQCR